MKQLAQALSDMFNAAVGYVDKDGNRQKTSPIVKFNIEVTDTFNGEPNYCWVRRYTLEVPQAASRGAIVRRAKRIAGWTGKRCITVDYGDTIELRPMGECQVCFINYAS